MNTGNYLNRSITFLIGISCLAFSTGLLAGNGLPVLPKDINAAPVLGKIESDDLLYVKASGRVDITNALSITDPDSKNLRSAAVQITGGYDFGEDVLRFKNQNGISGFWNKYTGILTLSGGSTVSNYQTALRNVQYENTNTTNPSTGLREVTFTVKDGLFSSNPVSRNIVIVIPNFAPVLERMETGQIIYCMGSGDVPVTSSLSLSDGDDENMSSAKIQITGNYTHDEDFLRFTDQNGISGNWDAPGGILTLMGPASKANYQDALRSIRYENTNGVDPVTGTRTVSFAVNDGQVFGNPVSRGVYVNGPVTAVLKGNATLCTEDLTEMTLEVDLTGTPPWKFTVSRDNGNEKMYDHISQSPYQFNVNQQGKYRIKSLSDANCTGDTSGSGAVLIVFNKPPTGVISGFDSICQGQTAGLSVALTGTAPWSITYARDGENQTVISNINTSGYTLKVTSAGTYTLTEVKDALCTNGKASGSATVNLLSAPTALLSGDASICESSSALLNVSLTGTAPWRFSYRKDNGTPVSVQDVNTSPETLTVSQPGNYSLYEVYDKFCKGTVSGSARIEVNPAPEVSISGLASAYNKEDNQMVLIKGSPAGGTFTGPGLFYSTPDWYFLPGYAPVGLFDIVYAYRESEEACYGYDTAIVRVLEASAVIDFPGNRTTVCRNDEPITIKAVNLNNSIGEFTISGDIGLVNNGDNTATIFPRGLGIGEYTITYTYYYDGVLFSVNRTFEIGKEPVADFKWQSECFDPGQSIGFTNTSGSTFGNLTEFIWTITTDSGTDTLSGKNIEYIFPDAGRYTIKLAVTSSFGCASAVTKTLDLSFPVKLASQPFSEDFEDSSFTWHSGSLPSKPVNSWELGDTTKSFATAKSGRLFWYTNVPSDRIAPTENSWVTSPCFDFSGTEKPMVIVDIWKRFNNLRDGAVLQASADSGKTWKNIGDLDDGLNWFNSYSILGYPGGQSIGWSNAQDNTWKEARHNLDLLKGKSRVQFRMAYGSDGTALNTGGIAFDNFRITERNRTALLEHFTNSADLDSKNADLDLNNTISTDSLDLVNLQYHTSFPGEDPFNAQEPYLPSARLLYYGLPDVPYTILNGGTEPFLRFDYINRELNPKILKNESLKDAQFGISIYSRLENNNALYIYTGITALSDMPPKEYTVHTGVLERKITGETGINGETEFQNVVKKFLPDPAGTTFFKAWSKSETDTVSAFWYPENVYNMNELRVFAFIQDESTSEIFQAVLNKIDLATNSNDLHSSDNKLLIYPNPADDKIFVKFGETVAGSVRLDIYNAQGALAKSIEINGRADQTEISASLFPDGIYIFRAVSGTSLLGTQKLTVTH